MRRYNPKVVEPKWQKVWDESKIYQAKEDKSKPKKYILEYFPYPSGVAMHVGHVRNYTIGDAMARHSRMTGHNVLHPMGWDAFGLPAENYAIKHNLSPQDSTDKNVKTFKQQLRQLGFSYDWSREINSSNPNYYEWTQWLFLQFYKKGLAYRAKSLQNWCPTDKTVLANEQVINKDGVNVCERDGTPVTQKEIEQWFLKITDYADKLVDDLNDLDWPENIKTMQRNWIGRSVGAEIKFETTDGRDIEVFTTRPDTLFGATYMVLAPEHPLVDKITTDKQKTEVEAYVKATANKTELDRKEAEKDKTGVFIGAYAINPGNKEKIPIWIADYVLMSYGTGAIMGVPAHDGRDWTFAKEFDLKIELVIDPYDDSPELTQVPVPELNGPPNLEKTREAKKKAIQNGSMYFTSEGRLINSGKYNGMDSAEARDRIAVELGKPKTEYRLRDWTISRQRYWGCPIPIIYCDKDGIVPVPEEDLPVLLPETVKFKPTGQSPLKDLPEFVNIKCPKCGGEAQRETDTFDTFIDSSWYFLRFTDPHNNKVPFSKEKVDFWLPVDSYIGGAEHAVVHLLYARFWMKALADVGLVSSEEPFLGLRNQGMIGGADGRKMGKRYGNVVTPDELIAQGYGADALRLYELFIGPYNQGVDWNPRGIAGTYRFLDRLWTLTFEFLGASKKAEGHNTELEVQIKRIVHKTVKRVSKDQEELGFNTAIAALMECVNELYKIKSKHNFVLAYDAWRDGIITLIQLLAPFAPHITEELWEELGQSGSVHVSKWPAWDESLIAEETMTLAIQINGKVRAEIEVPADIGEAEAIQLAKTEVKVMELLTGKEIKKAIYIPGRLVSLVT
ncbi:MAG TPA: leucine--tRNA ligase [Candidatus Saccharimonadales bacterium]